MSALIALFYMAAQSRCSAVANIGEGLFLVAREHLLPPRQKVVFVDAENIGHFEPMLIHRRAEWCGRPGRCRAGPAVPKDWWWHARQHRRRAGNEPWFPT